MDLRGFLDAIEKVNSDMFLFIIIFLFEKRPFSKEALKHYEVSKSPTMSSTARLSKSPSITPSKLIASPTLQSKFSPSIAISKSPTIQRKNLGLNLKLDAQRNLLNKIGGKGTENPLEKKNVLLLYTQANKSQPKSDETDENVSASNVPVNRKNRNNLKNIENIDPNVKFVTTSNKNIMEEKDQLFMPAVKSAINKPNLAKEDLLNNKPFHITTVDQAGYESDEEDTGQVNYEGLLYKITNTKKLKGLWFKLVGKDLYCKLFNKFLDYKSKEEQGHKGMHHLSGVFVKEEKPISYEGKNLFAFSVVYPKKTRFYYTDSETEHKNWMNAIKKVTGYANLTDIYDIKEKLGNGKFGLVRLGYHKQTNRKVAIKIMNKKDMTTQDLELVRTEIEILKICQHPNIIRILDVYENLEFMYIVMEYCSGGDLFTYIEKRGFKLKEERAAQLIHQILAAFYYLHAYGIAHRDLKPENILMSDNTEDATLRLLDFGLSKIIGPSETCNEPYGTLVIIIFNISLTLHLKFCLKKDTQNQLTCGVLE